MSKQTDKKTIEKLFDKAPTEFNNPGRETLNDADVGDVGMALLTLTRELWALNDRVHVLEAVLEQKGIDVRDEIERFQPDEKLQNELNEKAQALIENILEALSGS